MVSAHVATLQFSFILFKFEYQMMLYAVTSCFVQP